MSSSGASAYSLSFEISPIILTGGIAAEVSGGMIPIVSLTQGADFDKGLLSGSSGDIGPNDYFATFVPLSGGEFVNNQFGNYPFANQAVAANAVIAEPLSVSIKMICPARRPGDYGQRLSIMTALKSSLQQHNLAGGAYTVATPSFSYTNCLLISMKDVSSGESKQAQIEWQLDFWQPLLTLADAAAAQSALMAKLSSATPVDGDPPAWSGVASTVGSTTGLAGPSVVPAAANTAGSGVSPGSSR